MKESTDNLNTELLEEIKLHQKEHSLKNLRIADLDLFITAARMHNLSKAATAHHLSQSAASTAILRIETAFGLALSSHEKRQFALTRAGQILLPKLESWIAQLKGLIVTEEQLPLRLVTTHALAQIAVPALLSIDHVEFKQMRPDHAYCAILNGEADIALVLDNSPWKGVIEAEVGSGRFQLFAKDLSASMKPVLLPEDQMEVLALQQSWRQAYGYNLPIKSRIPSWSLIAQICAHFDEVGFLPDFLAQKVGLSPVLWQPASSSYRILAIFKTQTNSSKKRFDHLLLHLRNVFSS